jgi:hypothetical protein
MNPLRKLDAWCKARLTLLLWILVIELVILNVLAWLTKK